MENRQEAIRTPEIRSTAMLKRLMADYFKELDSASRQRDRKIAWCTSVGPAELLRAAGFLVYFPENHSAMLGATRTAMGYIPEANAAGYSPEICSYLTADIGAFLKGETPLKKAYGIDAVPKADLLVYNTNQCRDVQDWFYFYAKRWGVPILGIHSPRSLDRIQEGHVRAVEQEHRALVPELERISGKRFDAEMLRRVVALSKQCSDLWEEVLETCRVTPAPMSFFDATIQMAPAVVLRGTPQAVTYYQALKAELKERIDKGTAAVRGERFRLYWEGMPIWGKLRDLSNLFSDLRTCIVASTYCNSWIFSDLDPEDPFYSMAKAYTSIFICLSEARKEEYLRRMVRKYSVDGIIFHDARTCPNNSNSRYGMPERLRQRWGIPCLILNGDLNDLRCFSEEQAKTNIEAFIEQLEESQVAG